MPEVDAGRCRQQIRVDMDEFEQCRNKAVTFVNGDWYCADCAKYQQAHLDKLTAAEAQGIVISVFGETIRPESPAKTPDDPLPRNGGIIHMRCNGWVDLKTVSETHDALYCRSCGMRVVIPKKVSTWRSLGALRTQP